MSIISSRLLALQPIPSRLSSELVLMDQVSLTVALVSFPGLTRRGRVLARFRSLPGKERRPLTRQCSE